MSDSTFEEAKRCPQCKEPGREVKTTRPRDTPRGTVVHDFVCENVRCEGVDERWMVQTNPDGSIPQLGARGPKAFELPRDSSVLMTAAREELRLMEFMSLHPDLTEREARRLLGD